jgi:hypothetical protein
MKRWRLKWPDITPPPPGTPPRPLGERLLWMAAIWAISVLVLLSIAWLLRLVLIP